MLDIRKERKVHPAIEPDATYCWRCSAWLPDGLWGYGSGSGNGDGYGYGNGVGSGHGWSDGNGYGHGSSDGDGWGNGYGGPLPLCDDSLACAVRQAARS